MRVSSVPSHSPGANRSRRQARRQATCEEAENKSSAATTHVRHAAQGQGQGPPAETMFRRVDGVRFCSRIAFIEARPSYRKDINDIYKPGASLIFDLHGGFNLVARHCAPRSRGVWTVIASDRGVRVSRWVSSPSSGNRADITARGRCVTSGESMHRRSRWRAWALP
jgi:hypothetical protein